MSKGQPPTVIPLVKQEEGDDPLAWANDSSFAMESVNVIAAGTAAAEGEDENDEVCSNIGEESGVDEEGQEEVAPTPKETSRKKVCDADILHSICRSLTIFSAAVEYYVRIYFGNIFLGCP